MALLERGVSGARCKPLTSCRRVTVSGLFEGEGEGIRTDPVRANEDRTPLVKELWPLE